MPKITLPDGSLKEFNRPVTIKEIAEIIGAGLAKAAIAGKVDGNLVDLSREITQDAAVMIVTEKDATALEIIRHSTAHLLAHAVKQLFPQAQVTIGPVIENGFYYDFAFERPFTPEDLLNIEKRMQELAKQDIPIVRKVISRNDAIQFFRQLGEEYKAKIIEDIPQDQELTLYEQRDFTDLCRGPHVPSTGKIKAFKLIKLAGAYWRGDSHNEMLQRIYGTAWGSQKELEAYLKRLEEAEKRDHRKLGRQMDLFHFQEEAPGMVFWHDKGWRIYQTIIQYVRSILKENNYQEISTPLIVDKSLWVKSGHWEKFGEDGMFTTASENREYVIKPMNCPGHIQVFNQGLKSYRDLPLRMGEFGICHRNEASGTLHGLMRIRQFLQDDAHIFCTKEQLQSEINTLIDITFQAYKDFGFQNIIIRLATRPEKRIGSDEVWTRAENALEESLTSRGLSFELAPGEGAFYGPKIEFHLRDCLDRIWQCGTIQIDFSMPERLGAQYIAEDGSRKTPVMIHRVIIGSIERFVGILLEHYAGKLPLWLAPTQMVVMTITDKGAEYASEITETLKKDGINAISDLRNEKIGFKIREHTLQRVPYLVIVGEREVANRTITVRTQSGKDLGNLQLADFLKHIKIEIAERKEVQD